MACVLAEIHKSETSNSLKDIFPYCWHKLYFWFFLACDQRMIWSEISKNMTYKKKRKTWYPNHHVCICPFRSTISITDSKSWPMKQSHRLFLYRLNNSLIPSEPYKDILGESLVSDLMKREHILEDPGEIYNQFLHSIYMEILIVEIIYISYQTWNLKQTGVMP